MPDTQISETLSLMGSRLERLLAAVHANDPKREMLVRVGDLLRDVRSLEAALSGHVVVPREPTREMLNAAIDVDSFKLGDISPLGFRESPQKLFERCYRAMIQAAPPVPRWRDKG